jgi:hypothetical protein
MPRHLSAISSRDRYPRAPATPGLSLAPMTWIPQSEALTTSIPERAGFSGLVAPLLVFAGRHGVALLQERSDASIGSSPSMKKHFATVPSVSMPHFRVVRFRAKTKSGLFSPCLEQIDDVIQIKSILSAICALRI